MGFEPTTTGITIRDSTVELQPPLKTGLPDRTRTCDPQLRRLVLYPAELRADPVLTLTEQMFGRGGEIRTPDILLPKQARYQTALYPVVITVALAPSPDFKWGIILSPLLSVNAKMAH